MNRLQMATLLSWAEEQGFQGRKRLQKVVYLLQEAGCPLGCQFTLHHYGPYSRDVADVCDEMVSAGLVEESGGPDAGSMQYAYKLTARTRNLLKQTPDAEMQRFRELGERLIGEDLWRLELGSTILLFHRQGHDWEGALQRACKFKRVPADTEESHRAFELAKGVKVKSAG